MQHAFCSSLRKEVEITCRVADHFCIVSNIFNDITTHPDQRKITNRYPIDYICSTSNITVSSYSTTSCDHDIASYESEVPYYTVVMNNRVGQNTNMIT